MPGTPKEVLKAVDTISFLHLMDELRKVEILLGSARTLADIIPKGSALSLSLKRTQAVDRLKDLQISVENLRRFTDLYFCAYTEKSDKQSALVKRLRRSSRKAA